MWRRTGFLAALAFLAATVEPAWARIKLAALPERQRVEIQLDHGRYTLVEEERIVPLLKSTARTGNNRIDFSWSNTQIHKDSIRFRPLAVQEGKGFRPIRQVDGKDEVSVINVAYPPNENALVWEVYAAEPCAVKVRVSYLIDNLTRTFSYHALADTDETHLVLRQFMNLRNYSGEDFGSAGVWAGFGPHFLKLVGQQEDRKMLLYRFPKVAIQKTFTFDWYANGSLGPDKPLASKILTHYQLLNDSAHGLGKFPLQPGKVRIFLEDRHGKQAFLGEDWGRLTPLDGEMKLFLGECRDIQCTRIVEKNERHGIRGNLFDQEIVLRYEIENFRDKPCTLDIVEPMNAVAAEFGQTPNGDAEWKQHGDTSKEIDVTFDLNRAVPVLHVELPPRPKDADKKPEKKIVRFHFTLKNLW